MLSLLYLFKLAILLLHVITQSDVFIALPSDWENDIRVAQIHLGSADTSASTMHAKLFNLS